MNREDQLDQMIRDLLITTAETEFYDSVNERAMSSSICRDSNLKSEASTEDHPSRWKEFFSMPSFKRMAMLAEILCLFAFLCIPVFEHVFAHKNGVITKDFGAIQITTKFGEPEDRALPDGKWRNPPGYTLADEEKYDVSLVRIYKNAEGEEFYFRYTQCGDGFKERYDYGDDVFGRRIIIRGQDAHLLIPKDRSQTTVILWEDESTGDQFMMGARMPIDELMNYANLVQRTFENARGAE